MNGTPLPLPKGRAVVPKPAQIVQVMSDAEIKEKTDPTLRLPRQAERYAEIVNHFVAVKNSRQVARAMNAHFARLAKYHAMLIGSASGEEKDAES